MVKISSAAAFSSMIGFVERNLSGFDDVDLRDQDFHCKRHGKLEVILKTLTKNPSRPVDIKKEIIKNGKEGIATALLLLRSTTDYKGDFLKQAKGDFKANSGKDWFWNHSKQLTRLENKYAIDLYHNQVAYFNPQEERIETIYFMRFPEKMPLPNKGGFNCMTFCSQNRYPSNVIPDHETCKTKRCYKYHIQEKRHDEVRKISIQKIFDKTFSLEQYKTPKDPLIARFVNYKRII